MVPEMAKMCAFCLSGPVCTALSRLRLEVSLVLSLVSPEVSSLLALDQRMRKGSELGRSQGIGWLEGKEWKGSPEDLALAAE